MKYARRLITLLLMVSLLLSTLPATVLAAGKPSISSQPKSVTAYVGTSAKFTVAATGAASYQWQYRTSASGSWKATSATGSKTATLTVPATVSRNGYQYRCRVTNEMGTTNSSAATLTVKQTPVITTQPKKTSAAAGETARFTVKAIGAESYQWQYRTSSSGTWKNSPATGNKTATLKVAVTAAKNGYQYRCKVTNRKGTTISSAATLTLKTAPVITTQPTSTTANVSSSAQFTVKAAGAQSYQWQYRTSPSGSWKNTSATGNKTATLTVPATVSRNGYQYRCKVTNTVGTVISDTAILTVNTELYIKTQPQDFTDFTSETPAVTFTVEAAGGTAPYTYQWYCCDGANSTKLTDNAFYSGTVTATLTVTGEQIEKMLLESLQVYCVAGDSNGSYAHSGYASVTGDYKFFSLETYVGLGVGMYAKVQGGTKPYTYQWQYTMADGTQYTNISSSADLVTSIDDGYFIFLGINSYELFNDGRCYRLIVTDADGRKLTSDDMTLPLTSIGDPSDNTVDVGQTAQFVFPTTGAKSWQWYYRTSPTGIWKKATAAGNQTDTLSVPGTLTRNGYQYYCIATGYDGTTIESDTATLNVNGFFITSQPQSVAADPGESVSFTVGVSGTGLTYQWQYTSKNYQGFVDIQPDYDWAEGCTTNTLSFHVSIVDFRDEFLYRCVITDAEGNKLISDAAYITCKSTQILTQPQNALGGVGDTVSFHVDVIGGTAPYTYQWQINQNSANSAFIDLDDTSGSSTGAQTDTLSFCVTAQDYTNPIYYRCVITDANGISVTSAEVWVENALRIETQPNSCIALVGEKAVFSVSAAGGSAPYSYQWQYCVADTNGSADYMNITDGVWAQGANTNRLSFTVEEDEFHSTYYYRCIITDAAGAEVISEGAQVIQNPLYFETALTDATVTRLSEKVTFSVTPAGGTAPYTYHWLYTCSSMDGYDDLDGCSWAAVSENQLTVNAAPDLLKNRYTFRCVITDAMGYQIDTGDATFTSAALRFTDHPDSKMVSLGSSATFCVSATGGVAPYTYQWYFCTGTLEGYNVLTSSFFNAYGYSTDTLQVFSNTNVLDGKTAFRCVVKDALGNTITSSSARLVINESGRTGTQALTHDLIQQPQSASGAYGDTLTFELEVGCWDMVAPFCFSWQVLDGSIWKEISHTDYDIATQDHVTYGLAMLQYTLNSSDGLIGKPLRCVITDGSGAVDVSQTFYATLSS